MEVTMIKQRKKHDCGCSGHPRGRPKYTRGPCAGDSMCGMRQAVRERIKGRRQERAWMLSLSPDDEEI